MHAIYAESPNDTSCPGKVTFVSFVQLEKARPHIERECDASWKVVVVNVVSFAKALRPMAVSETGKATEDNATQFAKALPIIV